MNRFPLVAALSGVAVLLATLWASWWRSTSTGPRSAELSFFCNASSLDKRGSAARLRAECLARSEPRYALIGAAIAIVLLTLAAATALRARRGDGSRPVTGTIAA